MECGLVLKSVGYKSIRLDPIVPFDHMKGIIRNTKGKVDGIQGMEKYKQFVHSLLYIFMK